MATASERDRLRIIDALMGLLAERPFREIALAAVAGRADVPLAVLRSAYSGRTAILADFSRRIDEAVLADAEQTTEEDPAERLHALLARRLALLRPRRPAIRRLSDESWRDPALAAALHAIAAASMRWMMEGAGIRVGTLGAPARVAALTLAWLNTVRAWLAADDPDGAEALAALRRVLRQWQAMQLTADHLRRLACPLFRAARPGRPRRRRPAEP